MHYKNFIFSPFQENTFVLYDDTKQAIIIDPGNFFPNENTQLDAFITQNGLKVSHILNTHNHLDHIFGVKHIMDTYKVELTCHKLEVFWVERFRETCSGYGLQMDYDLPVPTNFVADGDAFIFGDTRLEVIHVPGHSAGGVAFYHAHQGLLFCGDILFQGSIGRTDLPGGNYEQLISGIKQKLFILPDDTIVFSGHGPNTTIGAEKATNPFLR